MADPVKKVNPDIKEVAYAILYDVFHVPGAGQYGPTLTNSAALAADRGLGSKGTLPMRLEGSNIIVSLPNGQEFVCSQSLIKGYILK